MDGQKICKAICILEPSRGLVSREQQQHIFHLNFVILLHNAQSFLGMCAYAEYAAFQSIYLFGELCPVLASPALEGVLAIPEDICGRLTIVGLLVPLNVYFAAVYKRNHRIQKDRHTCGAIKSVWLLDSCLEIQEKSCFAG